MACPVLMAIRAIRTFFTTLSRLSRGVYKTISGGLTVCGEGERTPFLHGGICTITIFLGSRATAFPVTVCKGGTDTATDVGRLWSVTAVVTVGFVTGFKGFFRNSIRQGLTTHGCGLFANMSNSMATSPVCRLSARPVGV